jgi:pilus assembly protein CpaE
MAIRVRIIAAIDRQPEELLRAAGLDVSSASASDLGTLAAPHTKQPDVVLLDLRNYPALPPAVATIRRQHPSTGMVLIASTLEPALLLEAMRAGVNEVVTDPLTTANLMQAIDRVVGDRGQAEVGRVFGFVGAKGGVGATTVAVNVATALGAVSHPDRALLIDLHPAGGDAALFAGVEPRFTVADVFHNLRRLDQSFFKTLVVESAPRTDLLASPETLAVPFERDKIQHLLNFAAENYKFTAVDLPRSDAMVLDALDPMAAIFIVANQELATVKSASRLATRLRQRYGNDKVTIVLSRSDRHADIGHADVEKAVRASVAHTFPSDYRVALQALNAGKPLVLENHNELSASFKRFANTLIRGGSSEKRQAPSGLFGRLRSSRS